MFETLTPFLVKFFITIVAVSLLNYTVGILLPFFHFDLIQLFRYAFAYGGTYIGYEKNNPAIHFPFGLSAFGFFAIFSILCSGLKSLGSSILISGKVSIASGIICGSGSIISMMMLVIAFQCIIKLPNSMNDHMSDHIFAYALLTISLIDTLLFTMSCITCFIPGFTLLSNICQFFELAHISLILNYITIISFGSRYLTHYNLSDHISNPIKGIMTHYNPIPPVTPKTNHHGNVRTPNDLDPTTTYSFQQ